MINVSAPSSGTARLEQVKALVAKFKGSIKVSQFHSTCGADCCLSLDDMQRKGHLRACCRSACATQVASCTAAAGKNGLHGVMERLVSQHQWGVARVDYFCEQSARMGHLDCSASTAFAIESLNQSLFRRQLPSTNNEAVYVQLVVRSNSGNGARWRRLVGSTHADLGPDAVEALSAWVGDGFIYHVCTGIACHPNPNDTPCPSRLYVWDFAELKLPPLSVALEESVQAVCVTPVATGRARAAVSFHWEDVHLLPGQWHVFEKGTNESAVAVATHDTVPNQTPGTEGATPLNCLVYISGCHMSGNPCPGAGIARSIRALVADTVAIRSTGCILAGRVPLAATLVAVDCSESAMGGMSEACFDRAESLDAMDFDMDPHPHLRWEALCELLQPPPARAECAPLFFLPGRDLDVECIARGLHALAQTHPEQHRRFQHRFLSPSLAALEQTLKPAIPAALALCAGLKGCFETPAYHCVSPRPESHHGAVVALKSFCMQHGFPVLCKGVRSGAKFCFDWAQVLEEVVPEEGTAEGGASGQCSQAKFVQQFVAGVEVTFAFAAFEGVLLGCVQMTKDVHTSEGKVWSGSLEAPPAEVVKGLQAFVRGCGYTGGGEVECVQPLESGCRFLIDFNPRFPSWIHASCLAGVNLAGLLVAKAARRWADTDTKTIGGDADGDAMPGPEVLSALTTAPGGQFLGNDEAEAAVIVPDARSAFRRTVVEVALSNCEAPRSLMLPQCELFDANAVAASVVQREPRGAGSPSRVAAPPSAAHSPPLHCDTLVAEIATHVALAAAGPVSTPSYLMSSTVLDSNFATVASVLDAAVEQSNGSLSQTRLQNRICVSVKTNPHPQVLRQALAAGFTAECISLCEVQAAMSAGFAPGQILLTGGGKFFNSGPCSLPLPLPRKSLKLYAVFADSLADLRRVVACLRDPNHWLDCALLGCRFSPPWIAASRFGLDGTDPAVLRAAAAEIRLCPPATRLGAHFHFGSSFVGVDHWIGMAGGVLHLARELSLLAGRPLSLLDLGGGWSPGVLSESPAPTALQAPSTEAKLRGRIFETVREMFGEAYRAQLPRDAHLASVLEVGYELGKCLSEEAGAVLTRVLEVREQRRPGASPSRAAVLDASVAELQCAAEHARAVFWLRPLLPEAPLRQQGQQQQFAPTCLASGGTDALWGRTCMEFDILRERTVLPAGLQPGDYIVFTNAGAYDMTMSYGFGDGVARIIDFLP